jgi:hypothetical protein
MKPSPKKVPEGSQIPVFPQVLHRVRARGEKTALNPTVKKRENTFSNSRDLREDRGTREMKTSHNDQTFHAR